MRYLSLVNASHEGGKKLAPGSSTERRFETRNLVTPDAIATSSKFLVKSEPSCNRRLAHEPELKNVQSFQQLSV